METMQICGWCKKDQKLLVYKVFGFGEVGSERRKIGWWTPPASWMSRRELQSRLPCSIEVVESKLSLFQERIQMEKMMI